MNKIIRYFLSSPKGCYILGVVDLIICLMAVYLSVQNACGGTIGTLENFQTHITKNEIQILLFGIAACLTFFLLGWNAQREWSKEKK